MLYVFSKFSHSVAKKSNQVPPSDFIWQSISVEYIFQCNWVLQLCIITMFLWGNICTYIPIWVHSPKGLSEVTLRWSQPVRRRYVYSMWPKMLNILQDLSFKIIRGKVSRPKNPLSTSWYIYLSQKLECPAPYWLFTILTNLLFLSCLAYSNNTSCIQVNYQTILSKVVKCYPPNKITFNLKSADELYSYTWTCKRTYVFKWILFLTIL